MNLGRLLILGGLFVLWLAGLLGRDQPALAGATLGVALGIAGHREWAHAQKRQTWTPLVASAIDGPTIALLAFTSGGLASGLDALLVVALLALVALPAALAVGLAIWDVSLYVLAVVAHPDFAPSQELVALLTRLLLFVLIAGAGAIMRAGIRTPQPTERPEARAEQTQHGLPDRANLIAMLSHELRTPLTSIKGFAQLMQRDRALSEGSQRFVAVIVAETNRAIRTIGDAVDLARLQSGQGDLSITDVDLKPIVESAVAALEHHDVEGRIRVRIEEPLPIVRADPTKLERVMVHLISNALRYSHDTAPIEVGAVGDAAGVVVWVQDLGQGIPPEKFAHIFDLEANDGTDGGKGEVEWNGSGLGLYISKHLVEAHGGNMWVESVEGKGSRFAFRLSR